MIDMTDPQKICKTDMYQMDKKIGAGSFGAVYEGYSTLTQEKIAMKVIDVDTSFEYEISKVLREI